MVGGGKVVRIDQNLSGAVYVYSLAEVDLSVSRSYPKSPRRKGLTLMKTLVKVVLALASLALASGAFIKFVPAP